jgi:cyclopropane fatty-acyl-phospholipid synthase-like methyltransferase
MPSRANVNYTGLRRIGGHALLFDREVGKDFANWERYYDRRQSAILNGSPGLFHGRDRKHEFSHYRDTFDLRPEHKLLDYGCATLGFGQHFLRHLDPGNYVGMNVSEEAIRLASQFLVKAGLDEKLAYLQHIKDGKLPENYDASFDHMITISVLTHSPPLVTKYARSVLQPGGLFAASVGIVQKDIIFRARKIFITPKLFLITLLSAWGWTSGWNPTRFPPKRIPGRLATR